MSWLQASHDKKYQRLEVWHYFDCVIVADAIGHAVACHWNERPKRYREEVVPTVEVLLYLREIGADSASLKRIGMTENYIGALMPKKQGSSGYLLRRTRWRRS